MNPQIKQFKVGNGSFNLTQAVATKQKSLLQLVGGKLSMRASATRQEIDVDMTCGLLMSLSENELDQIAAIVLEGAVRSNTTEFVDVESFQGQIFTFYQLVAEGVAFNLDDFFTFTNHAVAELKKADK
jgi:hypothetical protein